MDYKVFATALVELFSGYAKKYPRSEWVKTVLVGYTNALEKCAGLTIDAQQAETVIQSNKAFEIVLRDNPELTTQQLTDGAYKIPAEWR